MVLNSSKSSSFKIWKLFLHPLEIVLSGSPADMSRTNRWFREIDLWQIRSRPLSGKANEHLEIALFYIASVRKPSLRYSRRLR